MNESKKVKVLLIDDNEVIRIFFKDVFWLHGLDDKFELRTAEGVEETRKILKDSSYAPNIIFLDLVMPIEIDGKKTTSPEAGLTILKEIKESQSAREAKVFVFSAYADNPTRERAAKLGAAKFLAKEDHLPQDLVKILDDTVKNEIFS